MAEQGNRTELSPMGFASGMLLGAVIGFALWMATETFVFFPAFLGVGVVFGVLFSTRRKPRDKDDQG